MTTTLPAPPAGHGAAYRHVFQTAANLSEPRIVFLEQLAVAQGQDAIRPARDRLQKALDLLGVDQVVTGLNPAAATAAHAVLAQDRGLVGAEDFADLTAPWTAAGLDLPVQATGDHTGFAMIPDMTTDRICDELLYAAAGTDTYGAVLALTGYNFGELLAYESVRGFVEHDIDTLTIRWAAMSKALGKPLMLADLPVDAYDFLIFAASLARKGIYARPSLPHSDGPDNREVIMLSVAATLDVQHMINPRWDADDTDLTRRPTAPSSASSAAADPGA